MDNDGARQLVQRIVASSGFKKSTRLRDLLLYLTAHSLADPPTEVSETQIGLDVFHRHSFHPGEDSIVRVTTRQLRTRLEEYFRGEGQDEKLILEIPRGSYMPAVRERDAAEDAELARTDDAPRPRVNRLAILIALVAAGALCWAGWLWRENRALRAGPPVPSTVVNDLLISSGQRTVLVAADSGYFILQKMTGRESSLSEYVDRSYQTRARALLTDPRLLAVVEHLEKATHTGIAEMGVFARIVKQTPAPAKIEVRHARDMAMRDFKQDNFVILGAARANPWCELFEQNTAFRAEYDPKVRNTVIRNLSPKPGEPAMWYFSGADHYAHIAVVPNLTNTGWVLLASGTSMAAKEAGGEFITDPAVPARLARQFGVNDIRQLGSFEIVLKSYAVGGAPQSGEIVAARRR